MSSRYNKSDSTIYSNMLPTNHPDLFSDEKFELVHRLYGRLGRDARVPWTLPDGTVLKTYFNAPRIDELGVTTSALSSGFTEFGKIISLMSAFAGKAAPVLKGVSAGIQLISMFTSLKQDTGPSLADIEQKLNDVLLGIGATDYLNLLRELADMRANALATSQTLTAIQGDITGGSGLSWYTNQLNLRDAQLQTDINALLDDSEAYFRRVYVEKTIEGDDPNWLAAIPDRPNDSQGTMFEYSVALPTLMELIAMRLVMMKLVVPNFASQRTFSAEIDRWGRRIIQLSSKMGHYVRMTPITSLAVQSGRRQTVGNQRIEEFRDWDQHCFVDPPNSISPIGAADITTGEHQIEWQYEQFDEFYLSQGDLLGGDAGYWPPSIGPEWYVPPSQAVGLPDLESAEAEYLASASLRAMQIRQDLYQRIGGVETSAFGWAMLRLAHPGAPI